MSGTRVNICFHGIGTPARELEDGEAPYWISVEFFEEILELVSRRPDVGLSFDDGNASDVEIGLPALQRRRLRAAFFPLAGRLHQTGSVGPDELRALVAAGMTVGSHGMRHVPWRGLDPSTLDQELVEAREALSSAAGAPVFAAACPLGSYDRRVLGRLRKLGYAQVFTSDRAGARPAAWLQPRHSVRGVDNISTIRGLLEDRPGLAARAESAARITAKRWR